MLNKILIFLIILGLVLAFVLYNTWQVQLKRRDARRKQDLQEVARSLDEFYKTNGYYPEKVSLPKDPDKFFAYTYEATESGKRYQLYARLENKRDKDVVWGLNASCGAVTCNYKIP